MCFEQLFGQEPVRSSCFLARYHFVSWNRFISAGINIYDIDLPDLKLLDNCKRLPVMNPYQNGKRTRAQTFSR